MNANTVPQFQPNDCARSRVIYHWVRIVVTTLVVSSIRGSKRFMFLRASSIRRPPKPKHKPFNSTVSRIIGLLGNSLASLKKILKMQKKYPASRFSIYTCCIDLDKNIMSDSPAEIAASNSFLRGGCDSLRGTRRN